MNIKSLLHRGTHSLHLKIFVPYIIAGIIPVALFAIVQLLLLVSSGKCIITFLPLTILPFLMLAGMSYYFFITHSCILTIANPFIIYTLSSAYSFCSYAVLQETGISSLLLYAFFPVVFFYFEQMMTEEKFIPFAITCAAMLCIHPEAGVQIALLLFALAILALLFYRKFKLGNLVHVILLFLFSFGLASVRMVFYLIPFYAEHHDYSYEGFSLSYNPLIFISRLLPWTTASRTLVGTYNRMDLYFGLFPLILFLFFFISFKINLRKKVYAGLFTILIISMLEFSPVLYVFNLFHITYHSTLQASFFLVFWMLYIAAYTLSRIHSVCIGEILLTVLSLLILIAISWLWGYKNFHFLFLFVQAGLALLYIILLYYRQTKSHFVVYILLLTCLELGSNCLFSTNTLFYKQGSSIEASFAFQNFTAKHSQKETKKTTKNDKALDKQSDNKPKSNDSTAKTTTQSNLSISYIVFDYIGVGISLLCVFFLLFLFTYDKKERIFNFMTQNKQRLNQIHIS